MKKIKIFIVLLFFANLVQAQDEKEETPYSHQGYFNATSFGVLVGAKDNTNSAPFSFMMVNAYGITDQIALGLGVGVDFLSESYMPIVMDVRYFFRQQKFTPFAFVQAGYSVPLDNETNNYYLSNPYFSLSSIWPSEYNSLKPQGGYLFSPGVGLKSMLNDKLGMTFTLAYHFQGLSFDRTTGDKDEAMEIKMNRLEIKIGILFK